MPLYRISQIHVPFRQSPWPEHGVVESIDDVDGTVCGVVWLCDAILSEHLISIVEWLSIFCVLRATVHHPRNSALLGICLNIIWLVFFVTMELWSKNKCRKTQNYSMLCTIQIVGEKQRRKRRQRHGHWTLFFVVAYYHSNVIIWPGMEIYSGIHFVSITMTYGERAHTHSMNWMPWNNESSECK